MVRLGRREGQFCALEVWSLLPNSYSGVAWQGRVCAVVESVDIAERFVVS